jgi:hypothetical protein
MDRDRPRLLPDSAACSACGATVPDRRLRILAHRDDVAFVELDCPACHSTTLGLLMGDADGAGPTTLDLADDLPTTTLRDRAGGRPISADDVDAIRRDLAGWDGDLVGWLEALERGDRRPGFVDR